jgi:hypothetical protein
MIDSAYGVAHVRTADAAATAVVVAPGFWNVDVDVPAEILDERPRFVTSSREASQLVHPFPGSARPISDSSTASDEP